MGLQELQELVNLLQGQAGDFRLSISGNPELSQFLRERGYAAVLETSAWSELEVTVMDRHR